MSEWSEIKLSDFMQFNPTMRIAVGSIVKKIPMEYLGQCNRSRCLKNSILLMLMQVKMQRFDNPQKKLNLARVVATS
jgi:hypothetical protein